MTTLSTNARLEEIEVSLIGELLDHGVLSQIRAFQPKQPAFLPDLLLQRRFVSHSMTNLYDLAIDASIGTPCLVTLRRILREEYPDGTGNYPSHREDLISDLMAIGIPYEQILRSQPSPTTKTCIEASLEQLLAYSGNLSPLEVITFIRFIGEVLVAEEYKLLWPCIAAQLAHSRPNDAETAKAASRFFWPHIRHDVRISFTASAAKSSTHASSLGLYLSSCISSESQIQCFKAAEERAVAIKKDFYDQFSDLAF